MALESHQPEAWLEPESKQSACLSLPAGVAALGKGSPEGVGGTFGCQHSGWERERVGVEDIVPPLDHQPCLKTTPTRSSYSGQSIPFCV